jgi:hypothetical protein
VRPWLMVCAVVCASGCAEDHQYFRPTEHIYGATVHGFDEAIYQLVGPFGPFGEAKVWSPGAFREDDQNLLHVNIDLHNTSGVPIVVNPREMLLDPVRAGSELLRRVPAIETQALSVAPGAAGRIALRFVLPPDVRPGYVTSFGLRWQVHNGPQAYSQLTPFTEDRGYYYPYGYYPYGYPPIYGYGVYCTPYDPYCMHGAYGWGAVGGRPIIVAPPPSRTVIHVH